MVIASLCRAVAEDGDGLAHRRGPLPAAPMPRTRPQPAPRRNAPWVTRSASWPGGSSRARCAGRRMKGHRRRAGTPRIVRVGPSSVKGTRRSFLTAPQKRSSGSALEHWRPLPTLGPDGEGPGQRPGPRGARRTSRPTGDPCPCGVVRRMISSTCRAAICHLQSGLIPPERPCKRVRDPLDELLQDSSDQGGTGYD
jgi:hypothetical protein